MQEDTSKLADVARSSVAEALFKLLAFRHRRRISVSSRSTPKILHRKDPVLAVLAPFTSSIN